MKDTAEQVWARSRYEFLKSMPDIDNDDAASLLFSALDAYRRCVPVSSNDLFLLKCATDLLKQTNIRGIKNIREPDTDDPARAGIHRPRWLGTLPKKLDSRLKEIVSKEQWDTADKKTRQSMLWALSSGRFETEPNEEMYWDKNAVRPDKHPAEAHNLFTHKGLHPSAPYNNTFRYLYRDGSGAKEFDEGEYANETKHQNHPHNNIDNFGKYTGQIGLHSLYERAFNRYVDNWKKKAEEEGWEIPKDEDDFRKMFHAHKQLEWEGYNTNEAYDDTGRIHEGEALSDYLINSKKNPYGRLGKVGWLYGLEMLEPKERLPIMEWIMNGKPRDESAKKHFRQIEGLSNWEDWVPYLLRQSGMVRGPRIQQQMRAPGYSPGSIVNHADHSGKDPRDLSGDLGHEAIAEAVDNHWVMEDDGTLSHIGDEGKEGTIPLRDHIMYNALGEEGAMDEDAIAGYSLPDFDEDGEKKWYEKDQEEHLSTDLMNKYLENGWIDEDLYERLFGHDGTAKKYQERARSGEFLKDVAGPAMGGLNSDGTRSYSHMFDMEGSGQNLGDDRFLYSMHEAFPGIFTQPASELLLQRPAQWEEKEDFGDDKANVEAWADFVQQFVEAGGSPLDVPIVPRQGMGLGYAQSGQWPKGASYTHLNTTDRQWHAPNFDTLNPGFISQMRGVDADKSVSARLGGTYRGNISDSQSQQRILPNKTTIAAVSGIARPLDKPDRPIGEKGHILPTESLLGKIGTRNFWNTAHLPYVSEDITGVKNDRELGQLLSEMGLLSDIEDPSRDISAQKYAGDADYIGGYNFYSVEPGQDNQKSLLGLLDFYQKAGVSFDPWTPSHEPLPVYDPRAFTVKDSEDTSLTDMSRADAARYLLQHGNFGHSGIIPASDEDVLTEAHRAGILPKGSGGGAVIPHELQGHADEKRSEDIQQLSGENYAFPTKNHGRVFMSSENPADMADYFLQYLRECYDEVDGQGFGEPVAIKEAIELQQKIRDELYDEHYPFGLERTKKEEGVKEYDRLQPLIKDINNTYNAIEQALPAFAKILEKSMPGILGPDDNGTWNGANIAYMALIEAVERYVANYQTPEMNKKLGIGDENGNIMSYHRLPSLITEGVEPNDSKLHDNITEFIEKGNPNMLHLFYESLNKNSPIFAKEDELPTIVPPGTPVEESDATIARDVIKHAIARVKATQHPDWEDKDPSATPALPEEYTKADRRVREKEMKRRYNWVSSFMDNLDDAEINRMLKDYPEEIAASIFDRYVAHKGGGIHSSTTPFKHNAGKEAIALENMYGRLMSRLRDTNWTAKPRKYKAVGSKTYRPAARKGGQMGQAKRTGTGKKLATVSQGLTQQMVPKHEQNEKREVKQPLERKNAGTQTIMPITTNAVYQREYGHPVKPPFAFDFDLDGTPIFYNHGKNPPIVDLVAPPMSLKQTVTPGIREMDFSAPQQVPLTDIMDISGEENPALGHWARRNLPNTTHPKRSSDRLGKGEPLESLTFLDILKEDEEREKGDASPIKAAHRIFDLSDLEHLRGFSGDWVVNSWPEGKRAIIERDDDNIKVTGASIPKKLQEALKEVNSKNFVVDVIYDGKVLHIVDLLRVATEDVTEEALKHRMRALRGAFEASEEIKTPQPITTRQTDDEGLAEAVKEVEGDRVMLRDAESTYMEGEARQPKWVLLDTEKRVGVIILGERGQNNPVYRLGVGPISEESAEKLGNRATKMGGKHYMDIGTARGDGSFEEGDFAVVTVGSVSRRERGGEPVYALHGAKLQCAAESKATDSMETLDLLTKSGVPHIPHSVAIEGSQVIVSLPTIDDDVIFKAHRLENETGVLLDIWRIGKGESLQGDYPVRVAETLRPCWEPLAALMLKGVAKVDYDPRPYLDDKKRKKKAKVPLDPSPEDEAPPKKIEPNQLLKDPVIVKALLVLEELLAKEKMTWTGPKGLAVGLGSEDSAPRGPTELTRPETLPDFYPDGREKEKKPESGKKSKGNGTITTEEGEKAMLHITDEEAVLELRAD